MNSITINRAIADFPNIIKNAINNFEETVIVSETGSVVLIAQSEWNNIMETMRLLKDKQSLKALIEGHNTRNNSDETKGKTIQQAFYDL